jgi:hypothetical protein
MSYAAVLKHKITASNPQDNEPEKYDFPPVQEQKRKEITQVTEDLSTLSPATAPVEYQDAIKNPIVTTALELKKAKAENAKPKEEAKHNMKHKMEAMKTDLTTTLRKELKTMVTESTKAAVEDVRAEMKDYMTNKVESLISSVDSQLSALFQRFKATHLNTAPPLEISPGNHAGHQATGHVTPNPPHSIPQ